MLSADENIKFKVSFYETNDKNTKLESIKSKNFKSLKKNFLNKGFSKNTFWLKIEAENLTKKSLDYILELQNPSLDHVVFFDKNKTIQTGDHHKFNSRDIDVINFAFDIKIIPDKKNVYFVKINTKNAITIPIRIHKKDDFFHIEVNINRGLYLFLGFMIALIIYNSFLYLILREKPYLYYVLFQFFYIGLLISLSGLGYSFLWKDNIFLNELTHKVFDDLSLFFFLLFVLSFLETKKHFPSLYYVAKIFLALILVVSIPIGIIHDILVKPVMLGAMGLIFYIILVSVKKNILYSKYILLGVVFLLIGSLSTLLKNFGWIEVNPFTTWAIYLFAMFEGMFFSLAIAKRIEVLKEHDRMLQLNQKKKLQKEVAKQTANLQILLKELNHRVKNNLQIISSFITMALQNSSEKKVLQSLEHRVHAIALLHTTLYKSNDFSNINIKTYLKNIVDDIYDIYSPKVKIKLDIKDIFFEFEKAMTIGLIVNEIVTNMIFHAFKNTKEPTIKIKLFYDKNSYILILTDNGDGFDITKKFDGLGLKLIKRLSEKQLGGKLEIESSKEGSRFKIVF